MVRRRICVSVLGVFLALSLFLHGRPALAVDNTGLIGNVRAVLADESRQALPIENYRLDLIRYYASDDAVPLFVGTDRAHALIVRMLDSEYDGLDPDRYPIEFLEDLEMEMDGASPQRLAEIEVWFAAHFLMFSADIKVGRVLPRMVYPDLYMPRKAIDGENVLRALPQFPDLASFLDAWDPLNIEYDNLRTVLASFLEIRDGGGWATIDPGPDVAPGDSDPRIAALRARLDAEYGAPESEAPTLRGNADVLDPELDERLRAFQLDHDVPITGALDKATILALNVPVERRIEQIMLSMERLRWMPEERADRVLIANKGDGVLRLLTPEGAKREWRILPNCPRDNLAIVAGNMKTMVLNPPWEVPYDYFQTVLYPELKRDPAIVSEQGFELYYQDTAMPMDALPWRQIPQSTISKDKDKFRFRLKPGTDNPYGRYLYQLNDTDQAFLFDAPPETIGDLCDPRLPKGAIAVVDGLDLMDILVTRKLGPANYLERTLARRETLIVPDVERIPVMIVFQSAWIDANGNVRFSKDPYLEDLRLTKALEGKEKS
jgi:L,D-transpeptidase YcbB